MHTSLTEKGGANGQILDLYYNACWLSSGTLWNVWKINTGPQDVFSIIGLVGVSLKAAAAPEIGITHPGHQYQWPLVAEATCLKPSVLVTGH